MSDAEILALLRLVQRYANLYETGGGSMTLRDLVRDGETSMDEQHNADAAGEIAANIAWH